MPEPVPFWEPSLALWFQVGSGPFKHLPSPRLLVPGKFFVSQVLLTTGCLLLELYLFEDSKSRQVAQDLERRVPRTPHPAQSHRAAASWTCQVCCDLKCWWTVARIQSILFRCKGLSLCRPPVLSQSTCRGRSRASMGTGST